MPSGARVYEKIKWRMEELETQQEGTSSQVYALEAKIAELTNKRGEAYSQLALLHLPDMTAKSVKQTLDKLRSTVQEIFDDKRHRRQQLEGLIAKTLETRQDLENRLEKITGLLNEQGKERDRLMALVDAELQANDSYIALHQEETLLSQRVAHYTRRHEAALRERDEKIPEYEANPLFTYLLQRNLGTPRQKGNALTASIDAWVARSIRYERAKQSYDFLQRLPEHAERLLDEELANLDDATHKLLSIRKRASDKHGLTVAIERGEGLYSRRETILSSIAQTNADHERFAQERRSLDNTKGEYHKRALEQLKSYMKGQELSDLRAQASATDNPRDDQLIETLDSIDREIKDARDEIDILKNYQHELSVKLDNLNEVRGRFSSNDYEARRSRFASGFDIDDLLLGYLAGRYSSHEINHEIETSQYFEAPSSSSSFTDGFFTGGGLGGGFSSGGGFGGGSSGGGGGFSTGGGF